jgi:quinol monooxygenase YgiN
MAAQCSALKVVLGLKADTGTKLGYGLHTGRAGQENTYCIGSDRQVTKIMKFFKPLLCHTTMALGLLTISMTTPAIAGTHMDAADDVYWVLALDLAEGQDAAFEALMAEMVVATKAEVGARNYEWFRNGSAVHVYERYDTNAAARIHLDNFGENFAERFLAILTPTGLKVYGPAEGEVREELAGIGAVFYDRVGGFAR